MVKVTPTERIEIESRRERGVGKDEGRKGSINMSR